MTPRQVRALVLYDNRDISADLAPYLKSISYTDHLSGEADDLTLTLEDRAGLWQGAWMPEKGGHAGRIASPHVVGRAGRDR